MYMKDSLLYNYLPSGTGYMAHSMRNEIKEFYRFLSRAYFYPSIVFRTQHTEFDP